MRLRDPENKLKNITPEIIKENFNCRVSNSTPRWHRYQVKLITPMLGGGTKAGEPDKLMPVRATAIRGQLRYWWRFLARHRKDDPLDGENLFAAERDIWGGMAENATGHSSKVRLRIRNIRKKNVQEYDGKEAPYALFPARKQQGDNRARKLVREGLTFTLEIAAPSQLMTDEVEPALRWWATFGGLGSRTRRGCGSIHISGLNPVITQEASDYGCLLVFSGNRSYRQPEVAWKIAVQHLRDFRQKPGIARFGRWPSPGRSKWPEPDSIREITGMHSRSTRGHRCNDHIPNNKARVSFPRAQFGLPIIFKFKDERCGDPYQTELLPSGYKRVASPIILLPYPIVNPGGEREYRPAALLMPMAHLNTLRLELAKSGAGVRPACPEGQEHTWMANGWICWPTSWWQNSLIQHVDPIARANGTDALTAFMNFFEQGGQIDE